MTDSQSNENYQNPTPDKGKPGFAGIDERTGQALVDAARTGLYAAAGLADAMAGAVRTSYEHYQDEAKQRRAKRAEQAEDVKAFISQAPGKASNLPEQAREWPDQVRERAEAFFAEARTAILDLAERGKGAVGRVRGEAGAEDVDLTNVTEEGFGVNADTDAVREPMSGSTHESAPGEGFGAHPADVEAAGLVGDDVPADNLGEAAPVPGEEGSIFPGEPESSFDRPDADGGEVSDSPGSSFEAPEEQPEVINDESHRNDGEYGEHRHGEHHHG